MSELGTRAILTHYRTISGEAMHQCIHCQDYVKRIWTGRMEARSFFVVANVYEDGRWDRCEIFHPRCYEALGSPFGAARFSPPRKFTPGRESIAVRAARSPDLDETDLSALISSLELVRVTTRIGETS